MNPIPCGRSQWLTIALAALWLLMATPQTFAADALSGDTIRMNSGETLRLSGIHAPLGTTAELAKDAKAELHRLINGKNSSLTLSPRAVRDRYGNHSAQATVVTENHASAQWLQGELLRKGLAFVYPPTGEEESLRDMLALESEARRVRRGIWSDPFYLGTPAADLTAEDEGRYAFVRGKVMEAIRIKNKVYLNFGPDWRNDFTIMIAARNLKAFRKVDLDPLALKDKTVLARGWIKHNFGPMIEATHPAQITTLKDQE